ncbi:DUF488 family protein [Microbacterium sp. zg.Y1090]|uniref:DUF488 domain-containing protein n=1 Tax=Microbacterium wangruii TaxID=3049073 RepID=UPI00214DE34A|nr:MULTISPECIES: DUF488 family protein [unclassified Microbacterium]MCR2819588.1 DUF488 family protein [Microbacterium sp. zg.Y1090]MDL5487442.1 DUF488 family protein [Microbacterium sp. zg-Y1211]WIM28555.1 DUF488 family protein [Microbacterium sp. zg-Y1090]
MIEVKRVYDAAGPDDGFRVLVDRLWPRGLSKERARIDLWDKDVAPSPQLRTAFHHDGMPWDDFAAAYRKELAANPAVAALRAVIASHDVVTLLHAVRDEAHNHAVLLRDALQDPAGS